MKIHLVSGFLGSGKTTAIANAALLLSQQGIKAGVVTNDQGKYLVDSRFIGYFDVPSVEVTGGCFCCNFNQLEEQIDSLIQNANPPIIFAESVGSCTDLVATVLKPLLTFRKDHLEQVTFSGFTDARMLLMYLQGIPLPFARETNYIWEKQIEEAEILVVNKIDILTGDQLIKLKMMVDEKFPDKIRLFQNSLDMGSVQQWIKEINSYVPAPERKTIEVDYPVYGKGEANLAWLDEEIEITGDNEIAGKKAFAFIEKFKNRIANAKLPVGHLKFLVIADGKFHKISFTTISDDGWKQNFPSIKANYLKIMVNARIQASPEKLRNIMADIINELKSSGEVTFTEENISAFQPGDPSPTHRFID